MLIYDLTYDELETYLLNNNYKKFRAKQVWSWLYEHLVYSFEEMNNLPKDLITFLNNSFTMKTLDLVVKEESVDKTVKVLFGLYDKNLIETVLMHQHYGKSVCVTTQVGCNIGCSFCASGILKKKRDLTAGEIVLQIIQMQRIIDERISHVVIMGIGEPFDNYENFKKFISIINHPNGLKIGSRHITVSTSGLVPKIKEFAHLGVQVNLAISLHAPDNETRTKLMTINKRYSVENVIDAIKYYINETNRRVTIEYILIKDINDTVEHAYNLVNLLKGLNVYVNLIPYNKVREVDYERSSIESQLEFYDILKKANIQTTLRKEQGHDINAACGQLRSNNLEDK